jgi:eukaryotic-like serine/threonine-protein kinase
MWGPTMADSEDQSAQRERALQEASTVLLGRSEDGFKRSFAPGQVLAGRYEIVRMIGHGAMGEVYEAKDNALQERVALKIISQEIASNEQAILRFKREIQLARKVTHPNVCRIFEFGCHQESKEASLPATTFLTMELLEGETLTERLRRTGPMTREEALPIIEQLAAGLGAAHEAGVIHRDFKTGNVILVAAGDGIRAVIADFGLAHSSAPAGEGLGTISKPDEIVGTPEYMAPEQLKGLPTGPATDIYALGVVIYAMVTGRLPFVADSRRAAALKRLEELPPSPRDFAKDLDQRWEQVILRCLERNPADRFSQVGNVVKALRGERLPSSSVIPEVFRRRISGFRAVLAAGLAILVLLILTVAAPSMRQALERKLGLVSLPQEKRLAVLPFTVIGGSDNDKAFAAGLTETLTAKLSRLEIRHPFRVVPTGDLAIERVSTVEQARKEFGVNLALRGSLQRSNGMLRVTCLLIDVDTRQELDGDSVDASAADPFAVQDRVVSSVLSMLSIEPGAQERAVLSVHGTLHPAAYDYYLRGRGYLQDYGKPESVESAITVFKQALSLDPNYALAFAGLGGAYWQEYRLTKDPSWVNEALQSCQKAATLQPGSAESHTCLGTVYSGTGQYRKAVEEFQSSAKLEPTSDAAYRGLAGAYEAEGREREAESAYKQAIQLQPQYWGGYNRLGAFYFRRARYAEAGDSFREVTSLAPDNAKGYSNLGAVYLAQARYADAVIPIEKSIGLQRTADAYSNLGVAYFQLRSFAESAHAFEEAVKLNDRFYLTWGNLGDAYYYAPRERERAKTAYEKAISLAQDALRVNPHDASVLGDMADYDSMLGRRANALRALDRALKFDPKDPELMLKAAEVYNQLGDRDRSIHWLQRALAAGYSLTMVRDTPVLDNLRSDSRVMALLRGRSSSEE